MIFFDNYTNMYSDFSQLEIFLDKCYSISDSFPTIYIFTEVTGDVDEAFFS